MSKIFLESHAIEFCFVVKIDYMAIFVGNACKQRLRRMFGELLYREGLIQMEVDGRYFCRLLWSIKTFC